MAPTPIPQCDWCLTHTPTCTIWADNESNTPYFKCSTCVSLGPGLVYSTSEAEDEAEVRRWLAFWKGGRERVGDGGDGGHVADVEVPLGPVCAGVGVGVGVDVEVVMKDQSTSPSQSPSHTGTDCTDQKKKKKKLNRKLKQRRKERWRRKRIIIDDDDDDDDDGDDDGTPEVPEGNSEEIVSIMGKEEYSDHEANNSTTLPTPVLNNEELEKEEEDEEGQGARLLDETMEDSQMNEDEEVVVVVAVKEDVHVHVVEKIALLAEPDPQPEPDQSTNKKQKNQKKQKKPSILHMDSRSLPNRGSSTSSDHLLIQLPKQESVVEANLHSKNSSWPTIDPELVLFPTIATSYSTSTLDKYEDSEFDANHDHHMVSSNHNMWYRKRKPRHNHQVRFAHTRPSPNETGDDDDDDDDIKPPNRSKNRHRPKTGSSTTSTTTPTITTPLQIVPFKPPGTFLSRSRRKANPPPHPPPEPESETPPFEKNGHLYHLPSPSNSEIDLDKELWMTNNQIVFARQQLRAAINDLKTYREMAALFAFAEAETGLVE